MGGISPSVLSHARPLIGALFVWLAIVPTSLAAEPMPVTVVIAGESAVARKIPVVGSLAAREEVQVRSFIEGRAIEHILVEIGQMVEKGQPLALLDTTEARMLLDKNSVSLRRAGAAVAVEASRLEVASVSLAQAVKMVDRSRTLLPKGAVSQQLLDEHENAHARAVAEFSLARQSLALAEADAALITRERDEITLTIERSTVRAPEDGQVLRRAARLGAMTGSSTEPLFVLARDAAIEFVAQVTETSLVQLGEGMRAEVVLAGHDGAIEGVVRLNAAELDPATRSGEVRIALIETEGLRPGQFGRGTILGPDRRNISLPGSAVKTVGGASSVLVVNNDVVDLREVTVGTRQDGVLEIVDGLREGELIVLKSGGFLKIGDKVQPVMAKPGDAAAERLAWSLATKGLELAR